MQGAPKAPKDYAEEYDPTGYYARKTKHREEMLPLLAIIYVLALVCIAAAWVFA